MQDYPRDTDRFFLLLCPAETHIYDSRRVNIDKPPARSFVCFFLRFYTLSLSFVAVARVDYVFNIHEIFQISTTNELHLVSDDDDDVSSVLVVS